MLYGFDIGGTKIEFSVFNQSMERLYTQRAKTPTEDYAQFLAVITDFVTAYDRLNHVFGPVGIGLPGQQTANGITRCNNIPCIDGCYLQRDLEKILNRPIKIANDADCFALSEAHDKSLEGASSILALILGTGFGGGLVNNGRLYRGHNGAAFEVGHMRLPCDAIALVGYDNPLIRCRCGQTGCLDHYLSARGFADLYNHHYTSVCDSRMSAEEITVKYCLGDQKAKSHTDRYLELMATCLSGIIAMIDPEVIVFGGGLSNFDVIYDQLPELLKKHTLNGRPVPSIRKAVFGDSGGVRGAALLNASAPGYA
ncbi:hypothetical protein GV64_24560 [Endozoicomonas elysicola]|uniref:N-acetylglucosamine kinase n=1 Tax=Endozoicomonas elysicola TaxID=305900 RepID=A0A081K596_9GAMM|nr:hypothetical protein GV64_24560 [Endozoicomonas elysicola]